MMDIGQCLSGCAAFLTQQARGRLLLRPWTALLVTCIIALCQSPAAAAPLPREDGGYAYNAENTPLAKVLDDFCRNFGIRLQLAPQVKGHINGRLTAGTASEFISRVTETLGLSWFYYAGTLYVAPLSDWQTRTFVVSRESIGGIKQALTDLGVLEARFGWGTLGEQGLVLVAGPTEYLNLVGNTLQSLQIAPNGEQIAMFRLRYANAEDRTITHRDKQILIPGVASVLRGLAAGRRKDGGARAPAVAGAGKSGSGGAAIPDPLLSDPFKTNTATVEGDTHFSTLRSGPEPSASATIQSDTRLNAIIIKDAAETLPLYRELIAKLDVPAGLVEIEATTIDINRSRLSELGIDWSGTAALGRISLGLRADPTTVLADQAVSLLASVRLLENQGEARVIGRPSVLTTDNLSALIDLSQTFYVRVTGERVANLTPVTTGVTLKVTPHLIEQPGMPAEIQMVVDIEDGTLIDRAGMDLPVVQKSVISTQATISENQSLLIGGYDTESEGERSDRIPGLGSMPIIGPLFRTTQTERQRRKRMFLITPRIVRMASAATSQSIRPAPAFVPEPATGSPWVPPVALSPARRMAAGVDISVAARGGAPLSQRLRLSETLSMRTR
jgi:type III secretion protein C